MRKLDDNKVSTRTFFLCESFREDLSPSIIHQRGIIIPGAAAAGGTAFVCCPDPYPAKQKKVPAGFEWIYFFSC